MGYFMAYFIENEIFYHFSTAGKIKYTVLNILGGLRSSCTYVGAPSLKQLSKCTTFIRVNQQYNDTFGRV